MSEKGREERERGEGEDQENSWPKWLGDVGKRSWGREAKPWAGELRGRGEGEQSREEPGWQQLGSVTGPFNTEGT